MEEVAAVKVNSSHGNTFRSSFDKPSSSDLQFDCVNSTFLKNEFCDPQCKISVGNHNEFSGEDIPKQSESNIVNLEEILSSANDSKTRSSVSSSSESDSSYGSSASADTASSVLPSSPQQLKDGSVSVRVDNLTVGEGGIGTLVGNPTNVTVIQHIRLPGDEKESLKVVDRLKSHAESYKQLSPHECSTLKLQCGKDELKALQKRWCCYLLGLITVISVVFMLTSAVVVIFTSSHSQIYGTTSRPSSSSYLPSGAVSSGKVEGEDDPNGPLMLDRGVWLAQPPACLRDNNSLPVTEVVVCHTATDSCDTVPECVVLVRNIQQFHVESKKWCDIGYNFLIGGDGSVYEGRGWNFMGSHTKTHNVATLGIAFIGTFVYHLPTSDQLKAFQALLEVGVSLGKISADYSLLAQCQLKATAAPGWTLVQHLHTWPHFNKTLPVRCPNPQ